MIFTNYPKNLIIYKITNKINGKSYIGKTIKFKKRILSHKNSIKQNKCPKLYNAIKKYGWDNFTIEIIVNCLTTEEDLFALEKYFIKYFDTYNNGYNLTMGGEGLSGLKQSDKTKIKRKKTFEKRGFPMKGKRHTAESNNKNSLAKSQKFVAVKCLETNISYKNTKACAIAMKLPQGNISRCLRSKNKKLNVKGFHFVTI